MASAYNVSALAPFVQQQDQQLGFITKALLSAKTATLVRKIPGMLGPVALPIFDQDVQVQPYACTTGGQLYQGSGSLTITQKTITPKPLMVGENLCPADLQNYFTEWTLQKTQNLTELPFETQFINLYMQKIAINDEQTAWNGNTTSLNNNLSQVTGYIADISSSLGGGLGTTGYTSGSVHYSASAGVNPLTGSNVLAVIDGIYQSIPLQVRTQPDAFIAVGNDVFDTYVIALRNANLYNFPPNQRDRVINVPGLSVPIYGLDGLNATYNTNYSIVAGAWSNFFKVIAADADLANVKVAYNEFNDLIQVKTRYLTGYGVAKPYEVVWAYNGQ